MCNFKYILPDIFNVKLEKDIFEVLAETTKFKYLIEIEASILKNQIGNLVLLDPIQETNEVKLSVNIYEIEAANLVYNHEVIAKLRLEAGKNDDVVFAKSVHNMLFNSLRRMLRKIKRNAIRK